MAGCGALKKEVRHPGTGNKKAEHDFDHVKLADVM